MTNVDDAYMGQAIQLAQRARGLTSPNPMVGAVLVRNGTIVGQGLHRFSERKHAEVWALEEAGKKARGATLYVNLEPCCHRGRTGPCCQLIVESGVARVVAAMRDPNQLVAGKGFEWLRSAGVEVFLGVREGEAQKLNEAYAKYVSCGEPFVIAKVAATFDGKISAGPGAGQWITSVESRHRVHQLRLESDAILVGIGTALKDDPRLTDRSGLPRRRALLRVVLDSQLRLPPDGRLAQTRDEGAIIVFCGERPAPDRRRRLEEAGIEVIPVATSGGRPSFGPILQELGRRQVLSLLIEGGSEVNFEALRGKVIDKLICFLAPKILGGAGGVPMFGGTGFGTTDEAPLLAFSTTERIGPDLMIEAYLR